MARLGSIRTKFILAVCGAVIVAAGRGATGVSVWGGDPLRPDQAGDDAVDRPGDAAAVAHPTASGQ